MTGSYSTTTAKESQNFLSTGAYSVPVIPELACVIGDRATMLVQQVRYWLGVNEFNGRNFRDGRYWVYNTLENWKANNFPWLSLSTIKRGFAMLQKMGIIICRNYNKMRGDKTLWYSIDFGVLRSVFEKGLSILRRERTENLPEKDTHEVKMNRGHEVKMTQAIPEITSTREHKKNNNKGFTENIKVYTKQLYNCFSNQISDEVSSLRNDFFEEGNMNTEGIEHSDFRGSEPDNSVPESVPADDDFFSIFDDFSVQFVPPEVAEEIEREFNPQPVTANKTVSPTIEPTTATTEKKKEPEKPSSTVKRGKDRPKKERKYLVFPLPHFDGWNPEIIDFMNDYTENCVQNQRGVYRLFQDKPVRFKTNQVQKIYANLLKFVEGENVSVDTLYSLAEEHFNNFSMAAKGKTDFNLNHFSGGYDILVHYAQNLQIITQPSYGKTQRENSGKRKNFFERLEALPAQS